MKTPVMRKRVLSLLAIGVLLTALPACGDPDRIEDRVKAAVRRTDRLPFRFLYEDERPTTFASLAEQAGARVPGGRVLKPLANRMQVQGLIEDDFRYKALVRLGGRPAYEKVINDDALAVRLHDQAALGKLVDPSTAESQDKPTDLKGVTVLDALASNRWVLDPSGAPSQVGLVSVERTLGADPVVDSLNVFDYVIAAIDESMGVQEFSKDALDPAYRRTEDPFPQPDEGSGIKRYDLRRPKLPPVGATGSAGRPAVPATKHFRKMAIYVKDDRVVQVLERIEVSGRAVQDFIDYFKRFLREAEQPKEQIEEFDKQIRSLPVNQRGELLLTILAANLSAFGGDPIIQRSMRFDLRDLGEKNEVALPDQDVLRGPLDLLVDVDDAGDGSGGAPGGGTQPAGTGEDGDGTGDTATDTGP